jgi:catechol 2,3-dioxygenase-like lactoylglutathione lyase family enzyme
MYRTGGVRGGIVAPPARYARTMKPKTLDHIALWVADRHRISDFATRHLGMHVVDQTDRFTLVGSDARRGKLTLFDADGPRQRGPLEHVALRVNRLDRALQALPGDIDVEGPDGSAYFDLYEGLRLGLVEADTAVDYDLDHVALRSADPRVTADEYRRLGFSAAEAGPSGAPRVEVGGAFVEFHAGDPSDQGKPLLNHLAVLVDSAGDHIDEAKQLGVEVADVVDAANTYAVFLWGPERVKIEYVEHKPTFALK